tara:strand:+ start:307 stop:465 length:159 start_codon:yes stop_codon:yes gene_type:complete
LIQTSSLANSLFQNLLAVFAGIGAAFHPINSGLSIKASLIFSPAKVVQVSPS